MTIQRKLNEKVLERDRDYKRKLLAISAQVHFSTENQMIKIAKFILYSLRAEKCTARKLQCFLCDCD